MKTPRTYRLDFTGMVQLLNPAFDYTLSESKENAKFIDDRTTGKWLVSLLQTDGENNPDKFWAWAIQIHGGGAILVDEADYKLLRGWCERHRHLPVTAKVHLAEVFDSAAKEEPEVKAPTEE